jgi:YbbR domain-containing protein
VSGLFDNLALKLASLGLAVLLWFVIAGEKTSEMGVSIPVELQNFPKDLELTGEPVNSVEVRLRAAPGIIHKVGPGEISAKVDVAGALEGERIVHLTSEAIRVPFGVRVVKINPSIITLNFERTLMKTVPIRPRLLGRPAAGFEVAAVTSEPGEVRIAGPKSRVLEVESAFTEPVSVEGAEVTVVDSVNIGLEDPQLRIQGDPRIRVSATVREAHEKRTFDGLLPLLKGVASAKPLPPISVTLSGPASELRRLAASAIHLWVDPNKLDAAGTAKVEVELAPGNGALSVERCEPERISLRRQR